MDLDKSVLFKGTKNGIIILLDNAAEFDTIKSQLEKKIIDAKDFFGEAKCDIFYDGRELTEAEENELTQIITSKTNIKEENIKKINSPQMPSNTKKNDTFKDGYEEKYTKFYKGTLRSGQKIEYNGSVVVLGDVNPGAEVTASGNIIVLGTLKGIVHAGCGGNNSFVAALKMTPVQLRIADIIGRAPDKPNKKANQAEIAYIYDNMIYIEPIDQKLFVAM